MWLNNHYILAIQPHASDEYSSQFCLLAARVGQRFA